MRKFGEMKSSKLFIKGSEPIKNTFFTLLFVSRFLFLFYKRILTELLAKTLSPSFSSFALNIFAMMLLPYRK